LWAWFSLDSSGVARAIIWMESDYDDPGRFPARVIEAGPAPYTYRTGPGYPEGIPADVLPGQPDLAAFLETSETTAFLVIRGDELIYERYFNGSAHEATQTSFSVAKSFASALVGHAVADGFIGSVDEPITRYIPELLERDPRFGRITIRHLLSMSSGLGYGEAQVPWSDDALTYYAADLRRLALERSRIEEQPGRRFRYNNFNPLLTGLILERATGRTVSEYLSETLWRSLGAEADASWSLDSVRSGFEKMESGINARAIDFAKLGSLFLARGYWRGEQVLPDRWVELSTAYTAETDPSLDYQYGWWTFRDEELGDFYAAHGQYGQFIFVFPSQDIVVVRHGRSEGGVDWTEIVPDMVRHIVERPDPGPVSGYTGAGDGDGQPTGTRRSR
jgi:CubicO group peptidase (beta-lactamase class C family)